MKLPNNTLLLGNKNIIKNETLALLNKHINVLKRIELFLNFTKDELIFMKKSYL